jgi:hypothetical protein
LISPRNPSHGGVGEQAATWGVCGRPAATFSDLKDPERQLLAAITTGELDEQLVAIADAVHARRQLLHTVRSAYAIAELCVGGT